MWSHWFRLVVVAVVVQTAKDPPALEDSIENSPLPCGANSRKGLNCRDPMGQICARLWKFLTQLIRNLCEVFQRTLSRLQNEGKVQRDNKRSSHLTPLPKGNGGEVQMQASLTKSLWTYGFSDSTCLLLLGPNLLAQQIQ